MSLALCEAVRHSAASNVPVGATSGPNAARKKSEASWSSTPPRADAAVPASHLLVNGRQLAEAAQHDLVHATQRRGAAPMVVVSVRVGQPEPDGRGHPPAAQVHPAAVAARLGVYPTNAYLAILNHFGAARFGDPPCLAARPAGPCPLDPVCWNGLVGCSRVEIP
eukprot:365069-Chlamydomonas_euryale.AAC.11